MDNALAFTNNAVALKATQSTTYTKTETDTALALKANTGVSYTIAQSNTNLALKADQATTYTIAQSNSNLALQADLATTYTKQSVDMFLAEKAQQNQVSDISSLLSSSINALDVGKANVSTMALKATKQRHIQ